MSSSDKYRPGNPEYDYWNDKSLYPSLRNELDNGNVGSRDSTGLDDGKVGFGSVFAVVFVWLLIFAPFAIFFSWQDWFVQVVFWGGIVIVVLVLAVALYDAAQNQKS